MSNTVNRRNFLRQSSLLASAAALAPSLVGLVSCSVRTAPTGTGESPGANMMRTGRYGELAPVSRYPEISIPRGFHAERLSVRGDMMDDGIRVPQAFDGMGAFAMGGNVVRLVRNHEIRNSARSAKPFATNTYDDIGPSGTTTVEVELASDGAASLRRQHASINAAVARTTVAREGMAQVVRWNMLGYRTGMT